MVFLLWAREGGIYALAHVRGGSEKGESWYKGGHKETKPNTWKDFISCTEYLIDKKYTSQDKMSVWSGSAGGILVGRAITEKPELYAAAIVDAGMLNMLRIEKGLNGSNSAKEFGSIKTKERFQMVIRNGCFSSFKEKYKLSSNFINYRPK